MQQTTFSFEVIVCDDASTDSTGDIIAQICKEHPAGSAIKFYRHPENIGMMKNVVYALRQCTGKYIAVCEGDDYWTDPLKLHKQVEILEKEATYSMVITDRKVTNEDGTEYEERYENDYGKNVFSITDVINGFMPGTQTILFRNFSSLPDYLAAHPEFYYGDRYITYFCTLFGNIFLLPEVTAVYRMTGIGVWSVHSPLEKLNKYTSFMNDFHQSLGIPPNDVLKRFNFNAARTSLRFCLKRPRLMMDKSYREMIGTPWKKLGGMDKCKLLLTLFKR